MLKTKACKCLAKGTFSGSFE